MAKLSVNVNKIALLRNARGKNRPDLIRVAGDLVGFGVSGITVHPRPDGRHILYRDVRDIKSFLAAEHPAVELNVEGYPDDSFLQLMEEVRPSQCTLVPDPPAALTSNAGWQLKENTAQLSSALLFLKEHFIRTSLFVDPACLDEEELRALKDLQPDRAELYTQAYAEAWPSVQRETAAALYVRAAAKLQGLSIGVNAGHDLNLNNLAYFLKKVRGVEEVSIGHALICEALYYGLKETAAAYLKICRLSSLDE